MAQGEAGGDQALDRPRVHIRAILFLFSVLHKIENQDGALPICF